MITDMKDAKIFSPLQLGRTTLKNRIAMAPMSMHYEATNGTVPKQLADIFVRRAEGGAGYVVIDAVTVDHKYWYIGKTTALDKDSLVPQFAAFAKRVSDAGSTLFPQLIHPGPESICALKGITPLGPSVNTNANGAVSRPITIDEIHKVVKQYGQAARRAEEAGCGGIALHVAHAYMLPGAFLSPLRNKRMDEYGGCIDNRARLILEIIEECRRNISPGFRSCCVSPAPSVSRAAIPWTKCFTSPRSLRPQALTCLRSPAASNMRAFRTSFLLTARRSA